MGKLYFFIHIHHTHTHTHIHTLRHVHMECTKGETVFITMFYLLSKTASPVEHRSFPLSHSKKVIGLDSGTEK